LVSICENRSCNALDGLVDADVVDDDVAAVDDWLCAASNALMVAGDICEKPVVPDGAAEVPDVAAPERPNMSAVAWLKPVDWFDDEVDEANDWMASSAVDAAPRANSMAKLRQTPQSAAFTLENLRSANAMPSRKANKIGIFQSWNRVGSPGN
jgi:hypothetical protein